MEIYIDVLLLENFIINFFLILVTSQTMKKHVPLIRLFISALLSSLYVFTVIFDKLRFLTILPIKFLISMCIIYIALGSLKIKEIIKSTLIFFVYSFLLAGVTIYIEMQLSKDIYNLPNVSIKTLTIAVMTLYILLWRIVDYVNSRNKIKKYLYTVYVNINGSLIKLNALLDTGNELIEPVTNLPVIIVQKEIVSHLLSDEKDFLKVQYKTVSGVLDNMQCIICDKASIIIDHKNIEQKRVALALCNTELSNTGDYNALLSRHVI